MRLHRLEFRGLGPFRDTQVIDFAELGASGLFLLEGPTGSGKSTIIDAIVFALYGGVAGSSSSRGRLVSHFLTEREDPYAELVFETTAGVFRIRRTPTYDVAKSRGTGTTTRQGKVTLTRLSTPGAASGETLSTRVAEAGAEINRIVGLTKEQFVGTIVLPQGEFAAFLRAEGKERRPILQRIFRTEQYERLQQRLVQGRIDAERSRRLADQGLEVALGAFHGAAGSSPLDDGWAACDPGETGQVQAALEAAVQGLAEQASRAAGTADDTAAALALARDAESRALARAERRERLRDALARSRQVEAAAGEHAARAARLTLAERAERVADLLDGALAAEAALLRRTAAAAVSRAAIPQHLQDLDLAGLDAALTDLRGECVALAPVVALEQSLPARTAELARLTAAAQAAHEERDRVGVALAALPDRLLGVARERDEAHALAAQVPALELAAQRVEAQLAAATELAAVGQAQAALAGAAREGLVTLADAEQHAAALRARYLDGLAAELGVTLVDEQPCPVCGSREHPAPAAPGAEHVSREALEAAERSVLEARRQAEALAARLGEHDQTLARLGAQAQGLGVEEVAAARDEAAARLAAARAAAGEAQRLTAALGALEGEREVLTTAVTTAASTAAALDESCSSASHSLAQDHREVEQQRGGHSTVAERVRRAEAVVAALVAAVDDLRGVLAAEESRDAAVDQLATALVRESFADPVEARAALLAPTERAALTASVREHEAEAARVAAILAEPELQGVDPDEVIDVAGPRALAGLAEREHEAALTCLGEAQSRLESVQLRAAEVLAAARARDDLYAGTEALIAVARLADGKNLLSMDLATYVLQQRFDSVVAAANEHLRVMSDGQLQLVAVEEQEGRSQKAGLGLSVVDLRTDRERSPRTLSGGETFYTALSLALGLASVVTGEAGGVDLGTLFVDEGFGSLDGETLDDVLAVLTSLRAGGRTVGVVSHVEEMKLRIGERIEVRRDDVHGHSRLRVIA